MGLDNLNRGHAPADNGHVGDREHLPAVALAHAAWLMDCNPRALDELVVIVNGHRVVPLTELRRRGLTPTIVANRMAGRTASTAPPPVEAAA